MSFLGIGGLEFLLIFGVAMFFVGPKRLAEGVRSGRKYYTELRRYRQELTSLVTEAIDAEDLKKDYEETKRDLWDEGATKQIKGLEKDLALDQGDLDIPELDITRPVPNERLSTSKPKPVERGDGTVDGEYVPSIVINSEEPEASPKQPGSEKPPKPQKPENQGS